MINLEDVAKQSVISQHQQEPQPFRPQRLLFPNVLISEPVTSIHMFAKEHTVRRTVFMATNVAAIVRHHQFLLPLQPQLPPVLIPAKNIVVLPDMIALPIIHVPE